MCKYVRNNKILIKLVVIHFISYEFKSIYVLFNPYEKKKKNLNLPYIYIIIIIIIIIIYKPYYFLSSAIK
jgi:hypothetical protein